ncbi:hypothetical protein ACOBQB_10400 [Streptomyces sp. G5(2025)]|uniref:hypothetical protein n=1 Tax=Streptomyces sp. G5(2025) TaxID=3406628 RepID=UPI003C20501E
MSADFLPHDYLLHDYLFSGPPIEKLDVEHEAWEYGTKNLDWYNQDTIFFSIKG